MYIIYMRIYVYHLCAYMYKLSTYISNVFIFFIFYRNTGDKILGGNKFNPYRIEYRLTLKTCSNKMAYLK